MSKVGGKFTSHVFPGETLVVSIWKEGTVIICQTKTEERGKVVFQGFMELKEEARL
jgi:3-hydroxyacyl-CoA dehydrogenase/3a,7a,12a-trihydroxy-5b-cholest-24-enoyl-CoA hydratase/multifunctional beta-oxidation protein/peroxisomal enoyl-CoA hydratase 2